jgi:hypothetical protein
MPSEFSNMRHLNLSIVGGKYLRPSERALRGGGETICSPNGMELKHEGARGFTSAHPFGPDAVDEAVRHAIVEGKRTAQTDKAGGAKEERSTLNFVTFMIPS